MISGQKDARGGFVVSHPFHDETVEWVGHGAASRLANWAIRSLPHALSFVADGESIGPA